MTAAPMPPVATLGPAGPMQTAAARVAVIILTLNQRAKTLRCLESFGAVTDAAYRILLWDNGSTDGTVEEVRTRFPHVLTHHSPVNLGVAGGRNAAATLAVELLAPTHLLFLDNDTTIEPGCIGALLAEMARDATIGQTAPKIRLLQDPARLDEAGGSNIRFWLGRVDVVGHGRHDDGTFDEPRDCVAGGCTLVRTEIFRRLGGFDACFNPYGPEDMDFSLRLRHAGWRSRYVPAAVIHHERTQTFEGGSYTEQFASRKARNWIILMRRHASPLAWLGFALIGAPMALGRAVLREWRRNNLRALRGWIRGLADLARSSPRGRPHA